jgi:hypothetical protein
MTEHTPGPWKALPPIKETRLYRLCWTVIPASGDDFSLATVNGTPDEPDIDMAVVEADAFLMAAAPELLKALKAAHAYLENAGPVALVEQMEAAIKAAKVPQL